MLTGQTNTASRGPKDVSPTSGFEDRAKRVGALRFEPFEGHGRAFVRCVLGSSCVVLDEDDLDTLGEVIAALKREVF